MDVSRTYAYDVSPEKCHLLLINYAQWCILAVFPEAARHIPGDIVRKRGESMLGTQHASRRGHHPNRKEGRPSRRQRFRSVSYKLAPYSSERRTAIESRTTSAVTGRDRFRVIGGASTVASIDATFLLHTRLYVRVFSRYVLCRGTRGGDGPCFMDRPCSAASNDTPDVLPSLARRVTQQRRPDRRLYAPSRILFHTWPCS